MLPGGHICLIDDVDYPKIKAFKWSFQKGYAKASFEGGSVAMHRLIMDAKKGQIVDHKNGNGLDNRRSTNLRFVTAAGNCHNCTGWHKRLAHHSVTHPVFKGVWRSTRGYTWETKICVNGKQLYIGVFKNAFLAAEAYDFHARILHGKFARVNFPKNGEMGVHDYLPFRLLAHPRTVQNLKEASHV